MRVAVQVVSTPSTAMEWVFTYCHRQLQTGQHKKAETGSCSEIFRAVVFPAAANKFISSVVCAFAHTPLRFVSHEGEITLNLLNSSKPVQSEE